MLVSSRRTFLKGLGVAAAAPWLARLEALAPWPQPRYTLHGDGVHDDAPAIQELLDAAAEDREPLVEFMRPTRLEDNTLWLSPGVYLFETTTVVPRLNETRTRVRSVGFEDSYLVRGETLEGPMIERPV